MPLAPDFPAWRLAQAFIRREEAERFIEEVRGDDPELVGSLRIEEREAGGVELAIDRSEA